MEYRKDTAELGNCWHFAEQLGGMDVGPNDPMSEDFKKTGFAALIRGSVENSVDAVKNGKELSWIKEIYNDYMINISSSEDYKKITVADYVNLITPGIDLILDDPYEIMVERFVYDD